MRAALAAVIVLASLGTRAIAQSRDIVIETPGERTTKNELAIGGLAVAGLIAGAAGVYYHLDSRSLADEVSADEFTGRPWTQSLQAKVDRASDDRVKAGVFYGVGSALIIGAIVAMIVTEPASETSVIHPHATFSPTPGGALLGSAWSF